MIDPLLSLLLARDGRTVEQLQSERRGPLPALLREDGVADGPDVRRVLALPRRAPADDRLIDSLSVHLRRRPCDDEGRPNRLRAPQAEALREVFELGGLIAPMRVGSGKTLVTFLTPTLLQSVRPVLMVPASIKRQQTRRDFIRYSKDWRVTLPTLVSYEEMGRPDRETKLLELAPDLLLLDEAHFVRHLDAAVTRRVRRAIQACRERWRTVVVPLSGTLITPYVMDYWHLADWALQDFSPLPRQHADAERWAQALDRDVGTLKRIAPGALEQFPGGFHEHFRGSRGVVPTPGSDCDAAMQVTTWSPTIEPALQRVIDEVTRSSMRPDGELLEELELPECLCRLALGHYAVWDPPPPSWWLLPRRAYTGYVRAVLDEQLEGFDSPSQVATALDNPRSPRQPPAAAEARALRAAWLAVRDRFKPNPVPVWLDAGPLAQIAERAGPRGCLVWTSFRAAGQMLERLGLPYYGGGTDPESAPPGKSMAISLKAHGRGRNLQAWHRMIFTVPPANADAHEQAIGREHRAGQLADLVEIEYVNAIPYHADVLDRVRAEARATSRASGFEHKLCEATWL